jgi:hypothetical protein
VKGGAGAQPCSGEAKQLRPEMAGEDRIPVTDYRHLKSMEAHNVVEKTLATDAAE